MKINPSDVKVPLQKTVEVKNGVVEVSLSKRSDESCKACQEFVASYLLIQPEITMQEAIAEFVKYESAIIETSESAELTPAQKKLPPNLQKAILEKMKKNGKSPEPDKEKDKEKEEEEDKSKE